MNPRNLSDLLRVQAARFGPNSALRHKRHGLYRDLTWNEYWAEAQAVAAALIDLGVQPGDRVGLLSENRLEWLFIDMGLMAAGAVNVPAHPPFSAKQLQEQFGHAEISWLFVSNPTQFAKIQAVREHVPGLRGIVAIESVDDATVIPWNRFRIAGRQRLAATASALEQRLDRLGPNDLATIMYTSGTTGNSKGVMLTHNNLLTNAVSMVAGCGVGCDSVVLGWLPFSHIYGRLVDHYVHLVAGCTLCLAESQDTLIDNLAETQPTSFSAVPRFYEKVLGAMAGLPEEQRRRRLRAIFGSRIQWLNSGGAPLPQHVGQAFVDAGLAMLQGYGLTETSPVITFNRLDANRLGTVGQAVPGVEVKIAPDGEVLTRGPHVMRGYWKDPAATAETIHDGWLHTGDLGVLDADGYLTITGRKKDLMVLSNGKKIVPTHLEGLLLADALIDQALVYGEGKNFLTALIVPKFEALRAELERTGTKLTANADLAAHPGTKALMAERIAVALRDVASYEQIKEFILLPKPFTVEAEELTVSLKLRRGVIFQKHRTALEALYAGAPPAAE